MSKEEAQRPRGMVQVLVCIACCALGGGCVTRARLAHDPAEAGGRNVRFVEEGPGGLSVDPGEADMEHSGWPETPPALAPRAPESVLVGSNVHVTQVTGTNEAETTIAVNPLNPSNIIAGAICNSGSDCWYTSMDGGQTWVQGFFTPPAPGGGDPSVTFCGDGSAYFLQLLFSFGGSSYRSGLAVSKSTDGGLTWAAPVTLLDHNTNFSFVTDKPWISCDKNPGSPFANRIYVEHRDGTGANFVSVIRLRRSADGGATWQGPVQVSSGTAAPQNQGYVAVGNSGEVYVSWYRVEAIGDPVGVIRFDKSTNGGVTFGTTDVDAVSFVGAPEDPFFRRGGGSPPMDVDRSNGPYRGTIYIAWTDGRNGDADIMLIRSTDGGSTWSPPLRVNDDALGNGADQWSPTLTVDPKGRVIVAYYDDRRFVGAPRYEIQGQISRDGGQTFDTSFLISDTPSDVPTNSTFIGDYDSVAATSSHFYTVWADLRPGTADPPDVYTDPYLNNFDYDEVKNVRFTDHDTLGFDMQDVRFGQDLDYDVVSGLVSEMKADHGFTRASCLAAVWPASPFVDTRLPLALEAYYYLIRAHGPAGVGTYGDGSPARPNVRDPLDETLTLCP